MDEETPNIDINVKENTNSKDTVHSSAIQELLKRTGYKLELYTTCRAYGGPPPDFTGDEPDDDCQIFIGRLPVDMREDEIVPIFEKIGEIYVLKLIMDKGTPATSRGYAFLYYVKPEDAKRAIKELHNYEIRPGVNLVVSKSDGNKRLYMGNIQKDKTQDELLSELQKLFAGVQHVFTQQDPKEAQYNRGFAFVDFVDHKTAVDVRRQCHTTKKILFGRPIQNADWADFQQVFTDNEVNAVKTLHLTPLSELTTEEKIRELFCAFGTVDKVQKIRDFAFVHMGSRADAKKAKDNVTKTIDGIQIEISFANPRHTVKKKRKPRGALRLRGRGRGRGSTKNDPGFYPNFDYYGDPVYGDGYSGEYNGGYGGMGFGGGSDGYYYNTSQHYGGGEATVYRGGGAGVWMSKRRKPNQEKQTDSWADPSTTSQVPRFHEAEYTDN